MSGLYTKVKLYLEANGKSYDSERLVNFNLRDDGSGAFIEDWSVDGVTKPTDAELDALASQADAVENLNEIFSVKGVSGYMIGPYDLSASMGVPGQFDTKSFISALETIRTIAAEKSIPSGIHVVEPDRVELLQRIREGYEFIAYSVDTRMLDVACRNGLQDLCELEL